MTLIKSISGIRGTIGGQPGDALTPVDIVKFCYAYCSELRKRKAPNASRYKVVVGRDARISGEMVENLVCGTLVACGVDVVKCGFASTPTTELAVRFAGADGGIILTASHNPRQWNALKLLNERGEFLTAAQGQAILDCAERGDFDFAGVDELGHITEHDYTDEHIESVTFFHGHAFVECIQICTMSLRNYLSRQIQVCCMVSMCIMRIICFYKIIA